MWYIVTAIAFFIGGFALASLLGVVKRSDVIQSDVMDDYQAKNN